MCGCWAAKASSSVSAWAPLPPHASIHKQTNTTTNTQTHKQTHTHKQIHNTPSPLSLSLSLSSSRACCAVTRELESLGSGGGGGGFFALTDDEHSGSSDDDAAGTCGCSKDACHADHDAMATHSCAQPSMHSERSGSSCEPRLRYHCHVLKCKKAKQVGITAHASTAREDVGDGQSNAFNDTIDSQHNTHT